MIQLVAFNKSNCQWHRMHPVWYKGLLLISPRKLLEKIRSFNCLIKSQICKCQLRNKSIQVIILQYFLRNPRFYDKIFKMLFRILAAQTCCNAHHLWVTYTVMPKTSQIRNIPEPPQLWPIKAKTEREIKTRLNSKPKVGHQFTKWALSSERTPTASAASTPMIAI